MMDVPFSGEGDRLGPIDDPLGLGDQQMSTVQCALVTSDPSDQSARLVLASPMI
jgi:hypothetical protein